MFSTSQPGHDNPYDAIGASILNEALTRARGRHQPYCVAESPKKAYYVSNLAPTHGTDDDDDFVSQINPSAITLDFKPKDPDATLPVAIEFDLYYPSHPTYDEYDTLVERSRHVADINQLGTSPEADDAEVEADGGAEAAASDADGGTGTDAVNEDDLYALDKSFYRRVTVEYEHDLDLSNPDAADQFTRGIQQAIENAIDSATNEVKMTREQPDPEDYPNLDLHDLDESEFQRVIDDLPEAPTEAVRWNVTFGVVQHNDEVALRLMNEPVGVGDDTENADEPHVFNPKIEVDARLNKYKFDLGPDDYRFDQHIWAKGHNCSTTVEPIDEAADEYHVETTATPRSEVYEFEFNQDHDTRFDALAGNVAEKSTTDVLKAIADDMRDYAEEWYTDHLDDFLTEYNAESAWREYSDDTRLETVFSLAEEDPNDDASAWSGPGEVIEYTRAIVNFLEEVERFSKGIEVLDEQPDVLRSFQWMNEVNHRVHWVMTPEDEGFDGWRLFQLVFIVSNLPSIVARDPAPEYEQYASKYDDMAEVLWFPTGGGKTEAYLGLVLFNLFFDRLRGKKNGVTAWIRFPLRLLSRQQKSRFMKAMLVAEDIRTTPEEEGGLGNAGTAFSLGYFPGSRDSPNALGGRSNNFDETFAAADTSDAAQETLENMCQHLDECPLCGSEVTVHYDETANSVYHHCSGNALADGEDCIDRIPLYVTDRDIYRYTPSVLLGSLDKIAVMGMQPRFANLFGNFTTECPIHGLGYSDRCSEHDSVCDFEKGSDDLIEVEPGTRDPAKRGEVEYFDPIPTLHLIDEVHLLNEELGAFASHYETTYLSLCEKIGDAQPKVITSTATIAEYERQVENLFQKEGMRFPEEGPELGETFYGKLNEQKVEREYHGLTPNNRTHLYAVLDLVKRYHEVIRDYYDKDPGDLAREVVRAYHERNPDASPLDPSDENDLDDLVDRAGWTDALDADEKAEVLELYETSLVYFTNKREKDTYRKNIGKQIADEMTEDGYEVPLEEQQLTADTEDTGVLDRLEDPEGDWRDRIDTVPATSFVGHGIDVDRFNFMLFFGYPSQTFQYIQASSRVGRQDDKPGHVLDVFRPFDKRDRHRYKYFEKLHEYLSRTVEPVPIDRWAKFAVEKTFSGVLMSILLQYYRPLLFRKRDADGDPYTLGSGSNEQRVNLQNADHLYEAMNNDRWFPKLTKDKLAEHLSDAYGLDNQFYTNEHFRERVIEGSAEEASRLDDIWRYWNDRLDTEMDYPEFRDEHKPMINLRDIGTSGDVTSYTKTGDSDFIEALTQN
ncbi:DEAD/DEAH box helicase family protein [Natrinema ejinorense]|uniref:Helicase n=1 Tax=Natrinema ejinorense TaxID=373386 RepID=A0A2A5QS55_9EURY|nr:DEAD/DEAH box helicase family protein [Natrinema ejinorense]PCR89662.1 helicase [Natrinema ejinorense]